MLLAFLALALTQAPVPSGGAPPARRPQLVRALSGTKGVQERDRFVFEDQRSVFQPGRDRQVLVLFEWEGALGPHRCEGRWKDPSGKVVLTSLAELVARSPRFGVYWGLTLPDSAALGTWLVEAFVDGQPAGVHAFQLLGSAPDAPTRRVLALTELYERGLRNTLTLEALDAKGALLRRRSGVLVAPGLVQSSFAAVDGARTLRLATHDGRQLESREVLAWDIAENTAWIRVPDLTEAPLEQAAEAPAVGDRLFFLDASSDGTRVIIDTAAVGRSPRGDYVLGQAASVAAEGAPILNEYGEIAAVVVKDVVLGATPLDESVAVDRFGRSAADVGRARPLAPLPDATAAPRTLEQLAQDGVFVRPLAETEHFVSGVLGTGVTKQNGIPFATGQNQQFSRREQACVVFVTWVSRRKEEAPSGFEVFDAANRRVLASTPQPLKLRKDLRFVSYWSFAPGRLAAGVYRVDVTLGPLVVWRTFFRIVE